MWVIALMLPGGNFIILDGPGYSWQEAEKRVYHYQLTYGHTFQALRRAVIFPATGQAPAA
jgi:hypothetical protein